MKTKLVTAFYTDVGDHPFYGHIEVSRHDRYLHSLRAIANTKEDIICYCNETQYDLLSNYCQKFDLKNVTIKISNLKDYPNAAKMKEIKDKTESYNFYHEIDWNKFYLLEKEYSEEYDYIYWIDVGLSHRGLFLLKYNPLKDQINGMSDNWADYSFTGIFKEELFKKINDWVGNKLINLTNNLISHRISDLNDVYKTDYYFNNLTVGGIIGGHTSNLKWFIEEFKKKTDLCLAENSILNHELIMAMIQKENEEKYRTYEFDTWYHDDYHLCTPVFDNNIIKGRIHFVHFFEKELGI
jgi:hypothetical protein